MYCIYTFIIYFNLEVWTVVECVRGLVSGLWVTLLVASECIEWVIASHSPEVKC